MIFNHLILYNAHAGLLDCHFGQRNPRLVSGGGGGEENFIDLFLCIGCKNPLCFSNLLDLGG